MSEDPYRVLKVRRGSSLEEIKQQHKRLELKFHPDKVLDLGEAHKEQARERFDAIQAAYEQIKSDRGFK